MAGHDLPPHLRSGDAGAMIGVEVKIQDEKGGQKAPRSFSSRLRSQLPSWVRRAAVATTFIAAWKPGRWMMAGKASRRTPVRGASEKAVNPLAQNCHLRFEVSPSLNVKLQPQLRHFKRSDQKCDFSHFNFALQVFAVALPAHPPHRAYHACASCRAGEAAGAAPLRDRPDFGAALDAHGKNSKVAPPGQAAARAGRLSPLGRPSSLRTARRAG